MNKILNLLDEKYVFSFFKKELLPFYPSFVGIKKIKIKPHKKYIWADTYHVVFEFETSFITKENKIKNLSIFCSAHSNEPRKNFFDGLKFLWDNNFGKGELTAPRPLFYSELFNAVFYRGITGENLLYYISKKNFSEIETITVKIAKWLYKLHSLPVEKAKNFNSENSCIRTVLPGVDFILNRVQNDYPDLYDICKKIYSVLMEKEDFFSNHAKNIRLIHGDAHPENFIKISERKLGAIDFTDLCLADFARDLGSFMQQLDYMLKKHLGDDKDYIEKIKSLFLNAYLKESTLELTTDLDERIKTYYNFTAMRTATLYLIRDEPSPEKAKTLLAQISSNLKIDNILV